MRDLYRRFIISSIFPSLDRCVHTQANLIITGPVIDPDINVARSRLKRLNPEINAWLNQALAENKSVIYINLGNQINQKQWYIETMYEGLEELARRSAIKVIWVMEDAKSRIPVGYDKKKFLALDWVP